MCEYCKDSFTGNCNEFIFGEVIKALGDIPLFGASVYIDNDELKLYIDNMESQALINKGLRIKYCPFCGRELKK